MSIVWYTWDVYFTWFDCGALDPGCTTRLMFCYANSMAIVKHSPFNQVLGRFSRYGVVKTLEGASRFEGTRCLVYAVGARLTLYQSGGERLGFVLPISHTTSYLCA